MRPLVRRPSHRCPAPGMAHDARHSSTSVPDCVSSAAVARTVVSLPDSPRASGAASTQAPSSDGGAERHAGGRADPVGRHLPGRPFVDERRRASGAPRATRTARQRSAPPSGAAPPRQARGRRCRRAPLQRCRAEDRRDRRADVDARAPRADRHLRRPQVKRPLRQLMADRRCRSRRRRASSAVAERRRMRPARGERHERQQQRPRDGCRDERRAGARPMTHAGWYTLAHVLRRPRDTSPASRSSPPRC